MAQPDKSAASCEDRPDPQWWGDPDLIETPWEEPAVITPAPRGSSADVPD